MTLNEGKQRVVLNGQFSTLKNLNVGVPQGFILFLLLFLIYNNDLTEDLLSNAKQVIPLCFLLYMTFKLLQVILIRI